MLGLFNLFGRSPDLKALDQAFRETGLDPRTVPEAVKLTAIRLLDRDATAGPSTATYDDAARLLAYCALGHGQFVASNGIREAQDIAERLDRAIAAGDSLDARLVLLALHSGMTVSELADRIEIETG